MARLFLKFVEKAATKIKGKSYIIDQSLNGADIFTFVFSRLILLLRGVLANFPVPFAKFSLVFLGRRVLFRSKSRITIGKFATLSDYVSLDGLSVRGLQIGDRTSIGAFSMVQTTGVLTDIGVGFSIGKDCGMGPYCYVGASGGVVIGDNVIMGQKVNFHSENHNFKSPIKLIRDQGITRSGIRVGDNCWIGANVTILDGVEVGDGCVIAAGSVLRAGIYPKDSVLAGVPAKIVKSRLD